MKNFCFIFISLLLMTFLFTNANYPLVAFAEHDCHSTYNIYDENNILITTHSSPEINDQIITSNLFKYIITSVDEKNFTAIAKFEEKLNSPKITLSKNISSNRNTYSIIEKKIGLYMTHNAESYIIGDGYDSIYGEGGIHDVAKLLSFELENLNIDTILDETLHLPHDTSAYTRSNVTANSIWGQNVDAMFDIHRDAASRSTYLFNDNGTYKSKIRIVIGKSNPNNAENLEFALLLLYVADMIHPNLMLDIYYGSNEYNQSITPMCLLFECGTHLIEKEYVLNSMPDLANLLYTTMYNTYIDEETGDVMIGTVETPSLPDVNNEEFEDNESNNQNSNNDNNNDSNLNSDSDNNSDSNNNADDNNTNDNYLDSENNDLSNNDELLDSDNNYSNSNTDSENSELTSTDVKNINYIWIYFFCGVLIIIILAIIYDKINNKKEY